VRQKSRKWKRRRNAEEERVREWSKSREVKKNGGGGGWRLWRRRKVDKGRRQ